MSDELLTKQFKQYLFKVSNDAALVGVASVERFRGAPKGHHPRDFVPEATAVVAIALPIVSGLMNWHRYMEESQHIGHVQTYTDKDGVEQTWSPRVVIRKHIERRCCYEVINDELQALSMYGAIFLERSGYASTYLPTTYGQTLSWPGNYQWDFPKPPGGFAPFSHRHAAVAAGLGAFGLNNLLLTSRYGPRQRLVSIITSAPLVADSLVTEPICLGEKCLLCTKKCPAEAFGDTYDLVVAGHRNKLVRINKDTCRGYYKDSVFGSQCNRECMKTCPVGRQLDGE